MPSPDPYDAKIFLYKPWNPKVFFLIWNHRNPVTQNISITFIQCWTNVEDVGPTLYKCYTNNALCLLGNVLISSFRFIWIPMLWVFGHYTHFNSFSAGIVFIRQNLTSTDVRFWRIKTVPALEGLTFRVTCVAHTADELIHHCLIYPRFKPL